MAIKRCPYCKAIIDEEDKYCNNCGTQLLFPEDESIEEEIPGDKIIEEEEEEGEEEEEEEFRAEEAEEAGGEEAEEELEEEAQLQSGQAEEEIEQESGQLEEEFEEKEEKEAEGEEISTEVEAEEWRLEETPAEKLEGEEESTEVDERRASGEIIEEEEEAEEEEEIDILRDEDKQRAEVQELPAVRFDQTESEKKYRLSIEEDELVFKTKDLDQLTGTVKEGAKELEEFLGAFKKAEDEKKTTPATRDESFELPLDAEAAPGTKEELPPWASGMKESLPTPAAAQPLTGTGDEDRLTRREWTTDSGIGIPEKITQKTLPFADTAALKEEAERTKEEAPSSEEEKRRPSGLSSPLKARIVDVVFITALWLISLWFTAQVIGVSFFRLIFGSPIPVLAFYLILLLLYFFLFLYFLGETLGDHYFSEEDEDLHGED